MCGIVVLMSIYLLLENKENLYNNYIVMIEDESELCLCNYLS